MAEFVSRTITEDDLTFGLDWQESVIAQQNDPPVSPANTSRYLVGTVPTGAWIGHANHIAIRSGEVWNFIEPNKGFAIYEETALVQLVYNGTAWVVAGTGDFYADGSVPMTGDLDMDGNAIKNVLDPVDPQDGMTLAHADATYAPIAPAAGYFYADGSVPMAGDLDLATNNIDNIGDIAADGLIGFNGATPTAQGGAIADVTGGAATTDTDVEARAAIDSILAYLRLRGDIAT